MKQKILFLLGFILMNSAFMLHAQKEVATKSKIDKIVVFLSNAQIERSANATIPNGTSDIVISGLSRYLDPNSIRLNGKGDFVIMSHQLELKYPEPSTIKENTLPPTIVRKITLLSDSIENVSYTIQENQLRREVYQNEKNMLQSSKAISGADTLSSLRDGLSFYRNKMIEINTELLKINRKEKVLLKEKTEMEGRLQALRNYSSGIDDTKPNNQPAYELRIQTMSDKIVPNATIEFSYLASNVSWEPYYELKIDEVTKAVDLLLKANVAQNTGESWEKVNLVFSTGQAAVYKNLPRLNIWNIHYYMPITAQTTNVYSNVEAKRSNRADGESIMLEEVALKDAISSSNYIKTNQNLIFAEYEASIPFSIPSNGKKQTISLVNSSLDASYKYLAIPKMDKDVFLTAYLQGWEKLSLIQGRVNVIFQNSIISQTYLNPQTVIDTLIVSLGVDKRVAVERKKISDKSKERIIGNIKE
ncbi:MAG: DUF4139 domain-containing protein, partial [Bacteroidales bacterium]|nr:DUF4139 domain-containing protein [Bacteroidales bacterium]